MKTSVVIFVSGGIVQEVRSNIKDIEVDLVDYDNLEQEGKEKGEMIEIWGEATTKHPHVIF
jgi:hypothetical protein